MNQTVVTYLLVGAGVLMVLGLVIWVVLKSSKPTPRAVATPSSPSAPIQVITKQSGLKIEILKSGAGSQTADRGNYVSVHYTGWLTTGQKFDSSVDRGTPFEFRLGQGKVILGWEEGIRGMKVGEKRRLTVPPKYGYGNSGNARIPPKATLIFEVELIGVR